MKKKYLAVLMGIMVTSTAVPVTTFAEDATTTEADTAQEQKVTNEAPDGQAPEKPEGEAPDGQAPEKPEGEAPDGQAPEKPEGGAPNGQAPEKPEGKTPDGQGGPDGGQSEGVDSYTAVNEYTETYAGDGGSGYCNVTVSKDSTWTVTGDSTVTSLSNEGTIVDDQGKAVTIQGTDGTVYVEGDSQYTITTDSYSDSADQSGATALQSWSGYQTEKPSTLS